MRTRRINQTPFILVIHLLVATVLASGQGRVSSEAKSGEAYVQDEVVTTMKAIRAAVRAGDSATWDRLVSDKCQFVEPSGRITSRSWHAPTKSEKSVKPSAPPADVTVSEVEVFPSGDSATLIYREDMKVDVGGQAITSATRFTEFYRLNGNGWQLIFSAETPIVRKTAVPVDMKMYSEYVGEYQMAPELVGKVYLDGEQLMLIGTGWKQAYELLPLGHDTFFVKEMPNNEILFIRDQKGAVIAQGPSREGKGPTGKKIR